MSLRLQPLVLAIVAGFAGASPAVALAEQALVGERLSTWVLREHGPLADTTALHWHSNTEQQPQHLLRQAVLAGLESARLRGDLAPQQHDPLAAWIAALPVTGRLTLATHDPRALQVLPESDPLAGPGEHFMLFPRPTQVVVLNPSGQPCVLRHQPGAWAQDYLQACARLQAAHQAPVDSVWVAQADGRVQTFGVAPWNLSPQHQPSPGAWIWAPGRDSALSPELSSNLARLLATQVPPDAHPALQGHIPAAVAVAPQPNPHLEPVGPTLTGNDWGELGFMQTPSARMGPAGTVRSSISRVHPYTRLNFMLQPLDWFQFGFRYTDISNRLYGPAIAGDQSYKDKSIDLKLRLRPESATWPAIALGIRDIGGTGLFASEYLVASKRWGNWDASLGLAWGNMGSRGNVSNPLRLFGSRFEQRAAAEVGQGGDFNLNKLFTGPAALFGGVQWASPTSPWVFKAELDGNSFQLEPLNNPQPVDSALNLGLVYRWSPTVELALSWQRGNRLAMGLTLQGQLGQTYAPKLLDPALPPLRRQAPPTLPTAGWADVAAEINRFTGWEVQSVRQLHAEAIIVAEIDQALYLEQRIERATRLLHALAPADIRSFRLQLTRRAMPLSELHIDRTEWLLQHAQALPASQSLPAQQHLNLAHAPHSAHASSEAAHWQANPSGWSLGWSPTFSQIIGGPDAFILYQIGAAANAEWRLSPRTWVSGSAHLRLIDNFDRFNFAGHSQLPRVRTYVREYVTSSRLTLPRLQITHARHLGGNHYASIYGGLLETMYGGVGAEWLYRPFGSSWSFGVDLNHVQQRGFRQDFSFRDYRVTTGHATFNWDTGWNDVHIKLQAGRYLAGDHGVTLDISRTFRNGTAIGAWATLTDVPFEVFGEGSFDKGIYVRIPFDTLLPLSSPSVANLRWQPLTRDGGARLNRADTLFDLTQARGNRALFWRPAAPPQRRSAERTSYVLQEPAAQPFDDPAASAGQLFDQLAHIPGRTWLWAGGAVLGSALLDRSADRWAARHQGGNWERAGNAANAVPLALAAGSALLATGLAGPAASGTAQTALLAGAYTLGASMAVRTLVGRSRPTQGQGSSHFEGPSSGSHRSSFTSNHTALAFALVTPFARQHQMPWLYAVAAATALGRVQQREHWVSDTVGGALLGYGIGTLLSLQQEGQPSGAPRIRLTGQSVHADWQF
ncbi:MAG: YjbH domain-containing protein [Serpentinimonas sp.]|nr:YjbH domain-containing protein [Serpentinimonas sp.]